VNSILRKPQIFPLRNGLFVARWFLRKLFTKRAISQAKHENSDTFPTERQWNSSKVYSNNETIFFIKPFKQYKALCKVLPNNRFPLLAGLMESKSCKILICLCQLSLCSFKAPTLPCLALLVTLEMNLQVSLLCQMAQC
jgi:hypothetical protein